MKAGWPETASIVDGTTELIRAVLANWLFQCIGTKTLPRACVGVIKARTRTAPAPMERQAMSASEMPSRRASLGLISAKGSARCCRQPRAFACARHRMPMVAHAAGVEDKRISLARARLGFRRGRDEARLAIRGIKVPVGEEPGFVVLDPTGRAIGRAPAHRIQRCQARHKRRYRSRVCRRSRRLRAPHVQRISRLASHRKRHRRSPSAARHRRRFPSRPAPRPAAEEGRWREMPPLGIGDGSVFLAPGCGRQLHMARAAACRSPRRHPRRRRRGRFFSAASTRSASGR